MEQPPEATCTLCAAGKFSSLYKSAACQDCVLGKYSQQGATVCNDCMTVYNTYARYKVMPDLGETCFRKCDGENCLMSHSKESLVCAAGKGLTSNQVVYSSSTQTWYMKCLSCNTGYTRMLLKDYDTVNFFVYLAAKAFIPQHQMKHLSLFLFRHIIGKGIQCMLTSLLVPVASGK